MRVWGAQILALATEDVQPGPVWECRVLRQQVDFPASHQLPALEMAEVTSFPTHFSFDLSWTAASRALPSPAQPSYDL